MIVQQAKNQSAKLKLIASDSIHQVIVSLPKEILMMSAEEFLDLCSSNRDFDEAFNLEIKVVDSYGFIFEKNSNSF